MQFVLKQRKLAIFSLQHILYLLDTYSKNSDCKILNCIEYLPIRHWPISNFLTKLFVPLICAMKKRDRMAVLITHAVLNFFNFHMIPQSDAFCSKIFNFIMVTMTDFVRGKPFCRVSQLALIQSC